MNTVTEVTTRNEVWQYLAQAILDDKLPGPAGVETTTATVAIVRLPDAEALSRWVEWLGAGAVGHEQYTNSLGELVHYSWSEVCWHGWLIRPECRQREAVGAS